MDLVSQILLYSVQYSFSLIPAAAAAEFHNGTERQERQVSTIFILADFAAAAAEIS